MLADLAITYLDATPAEKQDILETSDLVPRLDKVSKLLARRLEVLRLSAEIGNKTRESLDSRQREVLLREQMAAIQKELGDEGSNKQELADLEKAIAAAKMPPEVEQVARKELRRLQRTPEAAGEYSMIRTYLDTLIELPWAPPEPKDIDIAEARRVLDADHYGLEKIKKRIVEYLAVRKLAPEGKAPILCFVGPPGVGKTSLGQSIARAMGRKFTRISLGGLHDEAEIRGHRRTYIGAMPGNVIQAIRKAGARDCVMMLDEIDKMGAGMHGDPSAALLEVLDPEQNSTFRDNYLDVPFDLSRIVFITTANMLETVQGPLRDRMEIIPLTGYTTGEKLEIAKRYLVRRQLEANGLKAEQIEVEDAALRHIIDSYTREAGVRNLEREIGRVLRSVAVEFAEGATAKKHIGVPELEKILGPVRFENEIAMRSSVPGVATGLAWTPVGGDILFIEATRTPGGGKMLLTGQLGEVMRESAQAAYSLVKSMAVQLKIEPGLLEKSDIHVHVPAGATPKDGPSAGVAMFMALTSLFTEPRDPQRHRHDRRDQPARPGAAGRRHQGEGRGRRGRRHHPRHAAGAQQARLRRHPRGSAQQARVRLAGEGRRRRCGGAAAKLSMAGNIRTGGCRCGAIRYEVTGPPVASVACHCRDCQYVSGGGANYSMVFERAGFKLLKGTPRVYKAKPTSGGSFFCESCGVHVFSGPDSSPQLVAVKVGSLDDRSDFEVQADIWMKSAPSWHRPHDGARQIEGNVSATAPRPARTQ